MVSTFLIPRELKVTEIQGKVVGIAGPRRAGNQLMKPVKEVSLYLDSKIQV